MMMTKPERRSKMEAFRRMLAAGLVMGGWFGSLGLGVWAVVSFDPTEGKFAPQWVGLGYIFLIGVAVAASTARSRMRMTDTIVSAFKTGQKIADDRWEMIIRTTTSHPDKLTRELEQLDEGDNRFE